MTKQEINDIIAMDLGLSSPEECVYTECVHCAPDDTKSKYLGTAMHNASEKCNTIIRYYDDGEIVRAYCVASYKGGIAIMYNRDKGSFITFPIGEDDGNWFITDEVHMSKSDFVNAYVEAMAIFNQNFSE